MDLISEVIGDIKTRNTYLQAFSKITEERAFKEALQADQDFEKGIDRGPLQGIPYAIKDLFDVENQPNTAGLPIFSHQIKESDASAVIQLSQAGAVLVGQTHTSPLGGTIIGINHTLGTPRNPWTKDHYIPGGSSSGSAVAVAAGFVPFALGTDTGGSIRVPASLCGIVGLKPTKGQIDNKGVWPLAQSLDTIGVLSRTIQDASLVYSILAGTSTPIPYNNNIRSLRIGICQTIFFDDAPVEIEIAVRKQASLLQNLGANITSVTVPEIETVYRRMCETSLIAIEGYQLYKEIIENAETDWVLGWMKIARTYSESQIREAQQFYATLQPKLSLAALSLDALIVPTTPITAVPISKCNTALSHNTISALLSRNTLLSNLAGWCTASIPCGLSKDGLPIGLMICADAHKESTLIQVGQAIEYVSLWEASSFPFHASIKE